MDIKTAVRELRKALGDTQQQFATRLNLAISTVVRYELSREPKGAMLIKFHQLAVKNNLPELADVFWKAASHELGEIAMDGVSDIWSKALNTRNMYRRDHITKEDVLQALTEIANMCTEMNPVLQWQAGDHKEEIESGKKPKQRAT